MATVEPVVTRRNADADVCVAVRDYLDELKKQIDVVDAATTAKAISLVLQTVSEDRAVFLAGNGGSASTCAHMANDWEAAALNVGFQAHFQSLTDSSTSITATANDYSYDHIFTRKLQARARPGDLLVVVSVSGRSPNILSALRYARKAGIGTVGLFGCESEAVRACDISVVQGGGDYGIAEDLQLSFNHMLVRTLMGQRQNTSNAGPKAGTA